MADNVTINTASGPVPVSSDDVGGGVQVQYVKLDQGANGLQSPVTPASPLAVGVDGDSIALLRRMVKLLEVLGTQDANQRLRVAIDTIAANLNLQQVNQVTTVNNLASYAQGNASTTATNADPRYNWADTARLAYSRCIRANLSFS